MYLELGYCTIAAFQQFQRKSEINSEQANNLTTAIFGREINGIMSNPSIDFQFKSGQKIVKDFVFKCRALAVLYSKNDVVKSFHAFKTFKGLRKNQINL